MTKLKTGNVALSEEEQKGVKLKCIDITVLSYTYFCKHESLKPSFGPLKLIFSTIALLYHILALVSGPGINLIEP
jgi:hypothetical protein